MFRMRHLLCAAALAACMLSLSHVAVAQPGGRGGGPGGRGGSRGFRGTPGGPNGTLGLALNSVIQKELEVSNPQKSKLESLSTKATQRDQKIREQRMTLFRNMRGRNNNGNPQGGNRRGGIAGNANNGGRRSRGGPGGTRGGGTRGGGPLIAGGPVGMMPGGYGMGSSMGWGGFGMGAAGWGGYGNRMVGNAVPGNAASANARGNRPTMDPQTMQQMNMLQQAQNELNQAIDKSIANILDRAQYGRLKQIQLQIMGIGAVLTPEIAQKLNLNEDQITQIRQILNEGRQASRQTRSSYFEIMRAGMPATNNQNNANGGRRRRPSFRDPAVQEAIKAHMEKPDVKAQLDRLKSQNEALQNKIVSAVYRVLTRRQGSALKKMFGPPFDMTKLNGNASQANGNAQDANDDEPPASKTAAPKAKPAAPRPRRKSLRELRGLDG